MTARNNIEKKALEMVRNGVTPRGIFFDAWMDMALREKEEEEKGE